MEISREFLEAEIVSISEEVEKAKTFIVSAQAVVSAYQMLILKIDEPEKIYGVL
jgi:hypothetical protein